MRRLTIDNILIHMSDREHYLISDIVLKDEDGKDRHIDYIYLSMFGIYIIEINNMCGEIVGEYDKSSWMTVQQNKRERFKNPIKKMDKDIEAVCYSIRELPYANYIEFRKLIVFPNKCELEHFMNDIGVVKESELFGYLRSIEKEPIYRFEYIDEIFNTLTKESNQSEILSSSLKLNINDVS